MNMFIFPVSHEDLFHERAIQMKGWGIPSSIICRVRVNIKDTWKEGPTGWTYEWNQEALKAEKSNKWLLASLCYGAARFPCAATESRKLAQKKQIECYLKASTSFPCQFKRKIFNVQFNGKTTPVAAHLFSRKKAKGDRPIVCLSGGVDTFKVELHRLALSLALGGDFLVVAIDMPGTGESELLLTQDAEQIYLKVIEQIQSEMTTKQKTAVVGISFGAHWAAKMALQNSVDAAVDIGGPIGQLPLDSKFLKNLPNGMPGIIGNALGLQKIPDDNVADGLLKIFSLREQGLLNASSPAPLLVINGINDPYIPSEETLVFKKFDNATVWQIHGATHCGAEKFIRFMPTVVVWLRKQLRGPSLTTSILDLFSKAFFPAAE